MNGYKNIKHTIENDVLRVTASPYGAELVAVQKLLSTGKSIDLLWNGNEKHWNRQAPILFPIVGRVKNSAYRYRNKNYSIDCPHGFLQSGLFTREEFNEVCRMAFVFESNDITLRQYPFPFYFRVEYSLHDNMFRVAFDVHNAGMETMPFSLGFHPGFFVPINTADQFEDCCIRFENTETPLQLLLDGVWMAGRSIPFPLESHQILPLRHNLFENDAVILGSVRKQIVSLCNAKEETYLTLDYSDFRYLALWQPPQGEPPFLCLETWNGLPDELGVDIADLLQKSEMILLAPRQRYTATLTFLIT